LRNHAQGSIESLIGPVFASLRHVSLPRLQDCWVEIFTAKMGHTAYLATETFGAHPLKPGLWWCRFKSNHWCSTE